MTLGIVSFSAEIWKGFFIVVLRYLQSGLYPDDFKYEEKSFFKILMKCSGEVRK